VGACYRQFTRPDSMSPEVSPDGNPLLHARYSPQNACLQAHAWYWIECLPPQPEVLPASALAALHYRITAMATDPNDGSRVVLRSTHVVNPTFEADPMTTETETQIVTGIDAGTEPETEPDARLPAGRRTGWQHVQ